MGRKPKSDKEVEPKKGRGRPKKSLEEQIVAPKSGTKGKKGSEPKDIETIDQIKARLLKKAKAQGYIDQSEIYDELNNYELDEDALVDLISFFQENDVEVVSEDDESEDSL